ncbi:surface glycoprotein [Halodesulfurarchaeum sp. HSR-GB]|uniref:right-handed parallel beta-helix repeat-containing protein n=1 Tax=Halodesulfurarchaeum sp. HSR-GB TaxID=3074077 RepID=UPI0028553BEB|nr:right-handed parallel beta-helix repeat-containing protein [Halodesulfurarchaeum sp. HSR-GB]MDR5655854.1 surface glycoprotein [Halodesulfurarchaeum sp. HSR-GB]
MSNRREKGRALFLTFLMVMSVVGMGVAFAGTAAAQGADIPDYSTDVTQEDADVVVGNGDTIQGALESTTATDPVILVTSDYDSSQESVDDTFTHRDGTSRSVLININSSLDNQGWSGELTLVSESGPSETAINAAGADYGIYVGGNDTVATIKGFAVNNFVNGGITAGSWHDVDDVDNPTQYMNPERVDILNNDIDRASASDFSYSVTIAYGTSGTIADNTLDIQGLKTAQEVGAILVAKSSDVVVENNEILNGVDSDELGIAVADFGDQAGVAGSDKAYENVYSPIENLKIINNTISGGTQGIGMEVYDNGSISDVEINHNDITGSSDAGISIVESGTGQVSGVEVNYNNINADGLSIDYQAEGTLDATHNWWGQANPNFDATMNGDVDVEPWYAAEDFSEAVTVYNDTGAVVAYSDTIQSAVDIAENGDTVEVTPGTYDESVTIDKKNVTLESTAGADETTINSGDKSVVIDVSADEVTIDGFNLTSDVDDVWAAGIHAAGTSNLTVTNNEFTTYRGLRFDSAAEAASEDFKNAAGVTVDNNVFKGEHGIAQTEYVELTAEENTFETGTEGIGVGGSSDITIENNDFYGDQNPDNGAIKIWETADEPAEVTINNNSFPNFDGETTAVINTDTRYEEPIDATSNWWGATDGPSGENFNGNGAEVTGPVTVDPATIEAENVNLQKDFLGIVKDDAGSLTVAENKEANLIREDTGESVSGTLVIEIADTEYVFEDAIQDGKLTETASSNGPAEIDVSTETGEADIDVVGNDSSTAVEGVGTVDLVHEALALKKGWNLKSIPQPATLHEQGIESVNQWNPSDGSYDAGIPDGEISDAENLNRGMYVEAEDDDARLGYEFATEGVPTPGQTELEDGWHLLGSNYDIDTEETRQYEDGSSKTYDTRQLQNDLMNIDVDGPGVTVFSPDQSLQLHGGTEVGAFDTYWVFVDSPERNDRGLVTPTYDPTERADLLDGDQ